MRDAAAVTRRAGRLSFRVAAAIGIVTTLVVSAGLGARRTIDALVDVHDRYATLDRVAREQAAGTHEGFDADVWELLRRSVRRGDRYLIVTPRGEARGLVNQGFVTRSYADYFLLPAVQVTSRRDADVIVYVGTPAPGLAECASGGGQRACVRRLRP